MKKRKFLIPSLLAAGFLGDEAAATIDPSSNTLEPVKKSLYEKLRLYHLYNLAAHRSHSSHGSHSSHRSSSGGGYSAPRAASPPTLSSPSRNGTSTPPSSILPSPPAASMLTLPGNSAKFRAIAMQVQTSLMAYGYYNGAIDGIIGAGSKSALSRFQSDFGLKVTGTITPEVLDAMGINAN